MLHLFEMGYLADLSLLEMSLGPAIWSLSLLKLLDWTFFVVPESSASDANGEGIDLRTVSQRYPKAAGLSPRL